MLAEKIEWKYADGKEECICCGRRGLDGTVVIDSNTTKIEDRRMKFVIVKVIDPNAVGNLLLSIKKILICPACFAHGRHESFYIGGRN